MKEKLIPEEYNGGMKRGKIFEVLNKKRKPDNTYLEDGRNHKKIKFIITKKIPNQIQNNLAVVKFKTFYPKTSNMLKDN